MAEPSRLVLLATHNPNKLTELARILRPLLPGIEVIDLDGLAERDPALVYPEPAETEATLRGNALLKARAAASHTGLPSVGDDSGLLVDALNQMPGVLSARWGGRPKSYERNNALLLDQLADVPDERRDAAFETVAAIVLPDGTERTVVGRLPGRIAREPRGTNGFGYDPVFVPEPEADPEGPGATGDAAELVARGRTLAQFDDAEKDAISHRGRALRALAPLVADLLG